MDQYKARGYWSLFSFKRLFEMNITNPYAQWRSGSGYCNGSSPLPSLHGALPFTSEGSKPDIHHFHFTLFNPDILNSTVIGPRSRPYFRIISIPSQNSTLIQDCDAGSVAVIEWSESAGATVEIRDIVHKQLVSSWLPLSADKK